MSAWAYRKCDLCGNLVHINNTCRSWNHRATGTECRGDPWKVIELALEEVKALELEKKVLENKLITIDRNIEHWNKKANL